ncbi:Melanoma Inhibitory Activity Protein 2 [Manis pentadactyla]|nr:Melanoma Inhibitory Activity Protein 2 [Manis pentadactyla]
MSTQAQAVKGPRLRWRWSNQMSVQTAKLRFGNEMQQAFLSNLRLNPPLQDFNHSEAQLSKVRPKEKKAALNTDWKHFPSHWLDLGTVQKWPDIAYSYVNYKVIEGKPFRIGVVQHLCKACPLPFCARSCQLVCPRLASVLLHHPLSPLTTRSSEQAESPGEHLPSISGQYVRAGAPQVHPFWWDFPDKPWCKPADLPDSICHL